jgi:hypothetical protein
MLSALCFVLCALCSKSHLLVKIGCFVLMLCALCLAVRNKRPDFCEQERPPAAAGHLFGAHAACFVLCAWRGGADSLSLSLSYMFILLRALHQMFIDEAAYAE